MKIIVEYRGEQWHRPWVVKLTDGVGECMKESISVKVADGKYITATGSNSHAYSTQIEAVNRVDELMLQHNITDLSRIVSVDTSAQVGGQ